MELDEITREVVDCGFKLHRNLGPGLLESVYKEGIKRIVNNHTCVASSQLRIHLEKHDEPTR